MESVIAVGRGWSGVISVLPCVAGLLPVFLVVSYIYVAPAPVSYIYVGIAQEAAQSPFACAGVFG